MLGHSFHVLCCLLSFVWILHAWHVLPREFDKAWKRHLSIGDSRSLQPMVVYSIFRLITPGSTSPCLHGSIFHGLPPPTSANQTDEPDNYPSSFRHDIRFSHWRNHKREQESQS
ncbi:hypothetical protein LZ32DRAFT_45781 [Colletotrichum eremochloae]|nr:hypothetical protein LZ32DRAFT_45781 [Colletotrichum eremochloae]